MFSIIISEKGGAERRETFEKAEINVGRVQGNDLVLPKGNVSKHHARLLFRDGRFIVTDLKSTNGTYVNGRKIAQATIVREGDKVYIGDFVIRVDSAAGEEPAIPNLGPQEQDIPTMARETGLRGPPAPQTNAPPGFSAPPAAPSPGPSFGPPQPAGMPPLPGAGPLAPAPLPPTMAAASRPLERSPSQPPPPVEPSAAPPVAAPAPARRSAAPPRAQTMPLDQKLPRPNALSPLTPEPIRVEGLPRKPSPSIPPPAAAAPSGPPPLPSEPPPDVAAPVPSPGPAPARPLSPMPAAVAPAGAAPLPAPPGPAAGWRSKPEPAAARLPATRPVDDPPPAAGYRLAQLSLMKRLAQAVDLTTIAAKVESKEVTRLERVVRDQANQMQSAGEIPEGTDVDALVAGVASELFALGPLTRLLEAEDITEIHALRFDQVLVRRGGHLESADVALSNDASARRMVMRLSEEYAAPLSGRVERRLASGAHLTALLPPVAAEVSFVIRKPLRRDRSLDELQRATMFSGAIGNFLVQCVARRLGVLVVTSAHDAGAELVAALAATIKPGERVFAVGEEQLSSPHAVALTAESASVTAALHLRPERLVVTGRAPRVLGASLAGPTSGAAVLAVVEARNGLRGLHRVALDADATEFALSLRRVADTFDVVVELRPDRRGQLSVARVAEVADAQGDSVNLVDLFVRGDDGTFAPTGQSPSFANDLGWDVAAFRRG
jgi:pilus assembly protein CpaF